jgi:hypothetical protein
LFLARQVFALDVGTNSAEEFLLVEGILEIQRFLEAGFVAFVGRLSVGVSKFVNPKLTSHAGEDLGTVFCIANGCGVNRCVVGNSIGHLMFRSLVVAGRCIYI